MPSTSNLFTHIAPSSFSSDSSTSSPPLFDAAGSPDLKPLYETIVSAAHAASENGQGPVIVLDGLAELLHMGFEAHSLSQLVRAVLALARKARPLPPALIIIAHQLTESRPAQG